jgi:hypothetical protein
MEGLHKIGMLKGVLKIAEEAIPVKCMGPNGMEDQKFRNPMIPVNFLTPYSLALEQTAPDPEKDRDWAKKVKAGSIIFVKDFAPWISDKVGEGILVRRAIKDALEDWKSESKCLVFIGPNQEIPPDMEKEITVVEFPLPDRNRLQVVLQGLADSNKAAMPVNGELESILDAAVGMTDIEAESALSVSLVKAKKFDAGIVRQEKKAILKKTNLIEWIDTAESLDDIGGLDVLKDWLQQKKASFNPNAKAFGVDSPKGLLLIGVPGCGKSLTAKAVSTAWERPLIRLDMGKVFGKYVGDSENNLVMVLKMVEAIAPCVLWIRLRCRVT